MGLFQSLSENTFLRFLSFVFSFLIVGPRIRSTARDGQHFQSYLNPLYSRSVPFLYFVSFHFHFASPYCLYH